MIPRILAQDCASGSAVTILGNNAKTASMWFNDIDPSHNIAQLRSVTHLHGLLPLVCLQTQCKD